MVSYNNAILELIQVFALSKNFAMYLLYVVVKYALHCIVIMFRVFGDVVHNDISYTCHTIAIYDGTSFLYSFFICLCNTYYMASSVIDIDVYCNKFHWQDWLYAHSLYFTMWPCLMLDLEQSYKTYKSHYPILRDS